MNRLRFAAWRLLFMLVSLWAIASITFLLVAILPSNPAAAIAGPYATPEQVAQVENSLGLHDPLYQRYFEFLGRTLRGDLGTSVYDGTSINQEIAQLIPSTFELIIASLIIAVPVGIALGAVGAYFHRKFADRASSLLVGILQSIPDFVLAVVLIYLFSAVLKIAPGPEGQLSIISVPPPRVTGMIAVDAILTGKPSLISDALAHLALPALTLGLVIAAVFARISRASLSEALESDQTKFARASGLPEWRVVQYAFLTSRTPVLTYGAIIFGALFGGTAIVETIFNWNGLSQWSVTSMLRTDYPAIQGFVLVAGAITLVVFALLDVLAGFLDPRVRAQ